MHDIPSQRSWVPSSMLLGFISSLQLFSWGQLTLAKDQNLFLIKIELSGEKKTKIKILPLLPFLFFARLKSISSSSTLPSLLPHLSLEWCRGMENWRLWSVHKSFSLPLLFPPHTFPLLLSS